MCTLLNKLADKSFYLSTLGVKQPETTSYIISLLVFLVFYPILLCFLADVDPRWSKNWQITAESSSTDTALTNFPSITFGLKTRLPEPHKIKKLRLTTRLERSDRILGYSFCLCK